MLTPISKSVDKEIVDSCAMECLSMDEKLVLNRPTGNFFYDPWEIKEEYIGTVWEDVLKTLDRDIGEARVIRLIPGEAYTAHADIDNRFHLNLKGEQSYLIDLENTKMHPLIKDYQWYTMDAGRIHVAANFGSINRYQLVVRHLLKRCLDKKMISITVQPSKEQHDYRYKFDKIISPFLNRANDNLLLSDFGFNKDSVFFKLSEIALEDFKKILTDDFEVIYA